MKNKEVVIIGSGPSGIGTAIILKDNCVVLEQGHTVGGLSQSITIAGAVFDFGGHSFHTPHQEVRDLVTKALDMEEQRRDARCFAYGDLIPYPFQKHFRLLSNKRVVRECAEGLTKADDGNNSKNFEEFILRRFGKGISKHFMLPYNRKLWGRDLKRLAADWTSERVAAPEGVIEEFKSKGGVRKPLQDNTNVAYPTRGGFGEIYTALGRQIKNIRFKQEVARIDAEKKIVYTRAGEAFRWRYLVSTLPINILLDLIDNAPSELKSLAARLDYLSLKLGLLVIGHPVDTAIQRIYCAEEQILPHKTTINHTSSRYLRSLPQHGIMAEISVGPNKKLISKDIEQTIVSNLKIMGFIKNYDEVIHSEIRDIEYAYPVPTEARDVIIAEIKEWLQYKNIYSSGRFGEWAYINSDESIYRGILLGKKLAGN